MEREIQLLMKKKLLVILLLINLFAPQAQTLYNPQELYEPADGLYDTDHIRDIYINFYEPNYDNILQNNWELNTGLRLPASLQLDGNIFLDSVGVRYKGNSTFAIAQDLNNPKLPLNIDINEYIADQHIMNYKKVKLANSLFDPTFCKEISAYNIYKRYLPSPEANFMNVHIQGQLLGCYVNTQSVDRTFLYQHFSENDGVFFKCDPIQQFGQPGPSGNSDLSWKGTDTTSYYNHYNLKSEHGWEELMNLIYTLNFNLSEIDSILNVDRVLWAFAVNSVVTNLDTYNGLYQHNYYLYQTKDGLFQMIPWDLTESFMGALLGHNSNPNLLYEYDPYNGYNCWYHPLVYQLLSDSSNNNSLYQKIYTDHIRTIIEESLDASIIENYVSYLQGICLNAVSNDNNKLFSMLEFYANVSNEFVIPNVFATGGITSTINIRKSYLQNHPEILKAPPDINSTSIFNINDTTYVTIEVSNADSVEIMTTISPYHSKFKAQIMFDDGTHGDEIANDQKYTITLPYQNSGQDVQYYFRAHNNEAIKLKPERAEYEFYIFSNTSPISNGELPIVAIFPNPFNNSTTIQFQISEPGEISLKVYNMIGQEVETLINDYHYAGQYEIEWNPNNIKSGMYIYVFKLNDYIQSKKLIYFK